MFDQEECKRLILQHAVSHPDFRRKLSQLSQLQEKLTYPDPRTYTKLMSQAMELIVEISSVCKLLDAENLTQKKLNQVVSWMLETAPELSYYAEKSVAKESTQQNHITRASFENNVGYVFLSWTVRYPRERAAMSGVKESLDYFGVKYFDFTEHPVNASEDESSKIEQQTREAVNRSSCSVELVSSEFGDRWAQYERMLLRKKESIVRIILHLETSFGLTHALGGDSDEARIIRMDFSDGRPSVHRPGDSAWREWAADASYYRSKEYIKKCYELGMLVRNICNTENPVKLKDSLKSVQPNALCSFEQFLLWRKAIAGELTNSDKTKILSPDIGLNFVIQWIIASCIGFGIGTASLGQFGFWSTVTFGLSLGIMQWIVLKQHVPNVGSWIWWSTIGCVIGFVIVPGQIGALRVGAVIGCAIGLSQWNVIQWRSLIDALKWILANAFAYAVGFTVANSTGLFISNYVNSSSLNGTLGGIVGGILVGIVTGNSLIKLLKRPTFKR